MTVRPRTRSWRQSHWMTSPHPAWTPGSRRWLWRQLHASPRSVESCLAVHLLARNRFKSRRCPGGCSTLMVCLLPGDSRSRQRCLQWGLCCSLNTVLAAAGRALHPVLGHAVQLHGSLPSQSLMAVRLWACAGRRCLHPGCIWRPHCRLYSQGPRHFTNLEPARCHSGQSRRWRTQAKTHACKRLLCKGPEQP